MSEKKPPAKPWSGRFNQPTDAFVEALRNEYLEPGQPKVRFDVDVALAALQPVALHVELMIERDGLGHGGA